MNFPGPRIEPEDEAAVIAAMILDRQRIDDVIGLVSPEDFVNDALQEIFVTLIDLRDAGKPTNIQTLMTELRAEGAMARIGAGMLARLPDAIGSPGDIVYYACRVRAASIKRRLRCLGDKLAKMTEDSTAEPEKFLDFVDCELLRLRDFDHSDDDVVHIAQAAGTLCDEIDAAADAGTTRGLRTGLDCFDRVNGGYQAGTLNVIAARPSNGKSVLGLQFAQSIGKGFEYSLADEHNCIVTKQPPTPTLFCSLEMTAAELSARSLASSTDIDSRRINTYRVTAQQRERLRRAAEMMTGFKTHIWQPHRATVSRMRARARIHRRQHGLGCLVIDYLQLIDSERGARHEKETYRIGEICRHLKALALELNIPVIVLCQLNRDAENKPPTLAQLADSGKIEQHADTITAIHRKRDNSNDASLMLLKWRNGQTPAIEITFDRPHCKFVEPPIEQHPNYHGEFSEFAG